MSQGEDGAAPEKSPAQKVAVRNRRNIRQFSVAGTYCFWVPGYPLRINAGELNWEGAVFWLNRYTIQQHSDMLVDTLLSLAGVGSRSPGAWGAADETRVRYRLIPGVW